MTSTQPSSLPTTFDQPSVQDEFAAFLRKRREGCTPEATREYAIKSLKNTFPITKWLPKYKRKYIISDSIAGLTVGLTVLGQGLAYAKVANLPVQTGLYSAFVAGFMYCIFGTAKDVTPGPTTILSQLTGAALNPSTLALNRPIAAGISMAVGLIQLAIGFLKAGFIVNFFSMPVMSGFTNAAALSIFISQIKSLTGIENVRRDYTFNAVYDLFKNITTLKPYETIFGLICFFTLLSIKSLERFFPKSIVYKRICALRNTIVVASAALVCYIFSLYNKEPVVLTPEVPSGLPPLEAPELSASLFESYGLNIAVIALVGFIENTAIAKSFSTRHHYKFDSSQELIALGMANTFSSLVGSYPVTGSFSRSALNSQSGVKTQISCVISAIVVMVALLCLTPAFHYIPTTSLAAVVMMAELHMLESETLKRVWRTRAWLDLTMFIIAFVLCLVINIEIGIGIAVGLSLLLLLYRQARPSTQYQRLPSKSLDSSTTSIPADDEIVSFKVYGNIVFASAEFLLESLLNLQSSIPNLKVLVLDLTSVSHVDITGIFNLETFIRQARSLHVNVRFGGVRPDIIKALSAEGALAGVVDLSSFHANLDDAVSAARYDLKETQTSDLRLDNIATSQDEMMEPLTRRLTIGESDSASESTDDELSVVHVDAALPNDFKLTAL